MTALKAIDCLASVCNSETCDGPEYHGQGDAVWCAECGRPFPASEAVINDYRDERRWCSDDCMAATGERQSVTS